MKFGTQYSGGAAPLMFTQATGVIPAKAGISRSKEVHILIAYGELVLI